MNDGIPDLIQRVACTGNEIDLRQYPTRIEGIDGSKQQFRELLNRLTALQRRLFIQGSQALVIILQGMDTSGKDGIIRHVLRAFNPQGCRVYSFGPPNSEEIGHDFLWRTTRYLPQRGQISVFNRSHYEEVLVVKVHPDLLTAEHVDAARVRDGSLWTERYEAIRAQERHLLASGTGIVKLMLHISSEEQARRLLARLSNPAKNWKFKESDVEERHFWDDYLAAYSSCLSATSTPAAPWHILPADDKRTARLLAAAIIVQALEALDLAAQEVSPGRALELAAIRNRLK
ncbi:MAG TPA: PPK2 family polyphosphate kinase [Dehalococcoidia bacterium]|nr:PPK2 family polyphosphate kinase [Dehalococcoidia bacterium]